MSVFSTSLLAIYVCLLTSLLAVSLKTEAVSFLSSWQQYAWYRVGAPWPFIKLMNKQMKSQRVKVPVWSREAVPHITCSA